MADPGALSPWYWPQHPTFAVFLESRPGLGPGWVCYGLPGFPWPLDPGFDRDTYGPPGTVWIDVKSAYDSLYLEAYAATALTLQQQIDLLDEQNLKLPTDPSILRPVAFRTPGEEPHVTIDVYRATIHAKVGTVEESVNVLHYISNPEVVPDPASVATFAAKVAVQWSTFLTTTNTELAAASLTNVRACYASSVAYDEVRAAHVQIVLGKAKWVGDTKFEPILGLNTGTGYPLPPQIAMCLSLGTSARGRSKRGRSYLGPLSQPTLTGTDGMFKAPAATGIAEAWKATMLDGMLAGTESFKLVILSPKTDARYVVTDVRVGVTPDTQRRRRRSYPELYTTV